MNLKVLGCKKLIYLNNANFLMVSIKFADFGVRCDMLKKMFFVKFNFLIDLQCANKKKYYYSKITYTYYLFIRV